MKKNEWVIAKKQLNESKIPNKNKLFDILENIANNWDELGLNNKKNYPKYLPSFDEFIEDLKKFLN